MGELLRDRRRKKMVDAIFWLYLLATIVSASLCFALLLLTTMNTFRHLSRLVLALFCACVVLVRGTNGNMEPNLLFRGIQAAVLPEVDMDTLEAAVSGLRDGSLALQGKGLQLKMIDGKIVPAVEMLWNGYMRTVEDSTAPKEAEKLVREMLLILIDQGLFTGISFENGKHSQGGNLAGTPLGYLFREMKDPELFDAFLQGGHRTQGTMLREPGHLADQTGLGLSYIHLIANAGVEVKIIREFYQLFNKFQRALEEEAAGGAKADFHDCLHQTIVGRVAPYSATAYDTMEKIRAGEPLIGMNMTRVWASQVDRELHRYMLGGFFKASPAFDWRELAMDNPIRPKNGKPIHANPILVAASLCKPGVIEAVTDRIKELHGAEKENAQKALRTALGMPSKYKGRSALHVAALRQGKSSLLWNALVEAERLASGNLNRLDTLVDDFGMVPNDYDGPATVVTEFSIQHPEMLSDSNDRIRNKVTDPYASVVQDDGNGGWGQQLHQVNKSGRCDLHEYQGMPSREELITIIERNEPAIFRGAALNWKMRQTWRREPFLKKFGHTTVETAEIPYASSFDAGAAAQKMPMSDYVATWRTDENISPHGAPMYLFTSDYTNNNPELREDVQELLELLGDANDPSVKDLLTEMSPQFFVGPEGSGAPMHWHNTALNALAYGEKHWYIMPPNTTFYSVLPTSTFAETVVPELRETIGVLECTQYQGDIAFAPEAYGHATLNVKASIGFAMEFFFDAMNIPLSAPPLTEDIRLKELENRQYSGRSSTLAGAPPSEPYKAFARRR